MNNRPLFHGSTEVLGGYITTISSLGLGKNIDEDVQDPTQIDYVFVLKDKDNH